MRHVSAILRSGLAAAAAAAAGCGEEPGVPPAEGRLAPPPAIAAVSPASGPTAGGTTLTITGTNFRPGAQVYVGGSLATSAAVVSSGEVRTFTPPGAPGPAMVMLVNTDGTRAALGGAFAYVPPPAVAGVRPASGPASGGQTVTVSGTGFASALQVEFAGTQAAAYASVSSTAIVCTTPRDPRGGGGMDVTVRNTDGQTGTLLGAYTFDPPPRLYGVYPASGQLSGNTQVIVMVYNPAAGATVTIGGKPAQVVPWTQYVVSGIPYISCLTPPNAAGPADVTVTNPDGQSSTARGIYTYLTASAILGVFPFSGDVAGGTPVTISGLGFPTGSSVLFGSTPATNVVVVSSQAITATAPPGLAGAATVWVANPTGFSAGLPNGYTYTTGGSAPLVAGVSPASGSWAGGATVTVTGTGFQSGAAVALGGAAATGVAVLGSTTLTAVTPRAPPDSGAALPVTVANAGGAAGSLASAFTYVPARVESLVDSCDQPDVAVDASGYVHVVWRRTSSGGVAAILYLRSTDGGRTWDSGQTGAPAPRVLSGTAAAVGRPRVAARGSAVQVVWNETVLSSDGATPLEGISAADSPGQGRTWSSSSRLLSTGPVVPNPAVALDRDGTVHVAFQWDGGSAGSGRGIYAVRGVAGGTFSTPRRVGGTAAGPASIASDGAGRILVAWDDLGGTAAGSGSNRDVWVGRSLDAGVTFSTRNLSGWSATVNSVDPSVAIAGLTALVTWAADWATSSGSRGYAIYAVGSGDLGGTWGNFMPLSAPTPGVRAVPAAAANGAGTIAATWRERAASGGSDEVLGCRTTDGGWYYSPVVNLSGNSGTSREPRVAGGPGDYLIHVWADDTASAGTFDILSR